MTTTKYIYNIEPSEFADLPYKEALQVKLEAAQSQCKYYVHTAHDWLNNPRFDAAYKAVKHNKQLLEELQ